MLPYLLALLLLAQHPEPTAEQKQITALVSQIRRLAASEPAVFGIDTRLKTADALTARYPKIAKDLLRDAQAALSGVIVPNEQDGMRVRIVELMAPLDLEEAEHIIGSIRHGRDEDYVAQAYDKLVAYLARRHHDTREMISKGLQSGGFRSGSAAKLLEDSKAADPAVATSLFAEILGAFPTESPGERDVYYLLDCTKQTVGLSRPLAVEAIDKAISAALSDKLQTARPKMLREITALLNSIDPELLERYKTERKELNLANTTEETPKPEQEQKREDDLPDLSDLPYVEALSRVRKVADALIRTGALIEISRREDITAQQRSSVASEALSAASKLPIDESRLMALAMLSRDFARRNEPANAAFAAQLLSETYSKACDCQNATCEHGDDRFDCLELVQSFAEYLDEFKISPESMNLDNISLEARLLVLKLYPLLGLKAPTLWFLGK